MPEDKSDPVEQIEQAGETLARVKEQISRRIVGQAEVVDLALTAILSGGHALVVGVPRYHHMPSRAIRMSRSPQ